MEQQLVNIPIAPPPPSGKKSYKIPIWSTVVGVTSLIVWLIFIVFLGLGAFTDGHQFPRKAMEVLYSYPLFVTVAVILSWVKRKFVWTIAPFTVLLSLIIVFSIVGIRNDGQSRRLNTSADKNLISYNLDNLAEIKVPQSFSGGEDLSQKTPNYINSDYLDPIKGSAIFYFILDRVAYSTYPGNDYEPVKLAIDIYNPSAKFEDIAVDVDRVDSGYHDGLLDRRLYDTETLLDDVDSSLVRTTFTAALIAGDPSITALIYTNNKYHYRLTLDYWDESYITNDAARKLLEKVIPTIVIKDTLDLRAGGIVDILQEKYPKINQEKSEDLKAMVKQMMTKADSYGLKTGEEVMAYITSAWLLGENFDTAFPAVNQKLADSTLSGTEKAKWLEDWLMELLKTPEMKIIQATAEKIAAEAPKKDFHKAADPKVLSGTRLANNTWTVFLSDKTTDGELHYYWVNIGETDGGKVLKITSLRPTQLGEETWLSPDIGLFFDSGLRIVVSGDEVPSFPDGADGFGILYKIKLEVVDAAESSTIELEFRRDGDGTIIKGQNETTWRGYSIQITNVDNNTVYLTVNKLK